MLEEEDKKNERRIKSVILIFLLIIALLISTSPIFILTASAEDMPDLIIYEITWTPSTLKTGDTVTFTVTYKNQGTLSAGRKFNICLYVDGSLVTSNYVNDLSAGASATTTFTWGVGRDVSGGAHSVSAYVDMNRKDGANAWITESDESDNEKTKTFQVTKQAPDLIIPDITWNPSSPKTGDTVTFTVTYKNQGTLSAGRKFNICLYVDGSLVTSNYVNDLSAGASATTTFTWGVGRDVSGGAHSVSAYVDMNRKDGANAWITESDESDNEKTKTFQVTKQAPDLIIPDITWNPSSPKTGDTVTFTVTYKNQGTLSAGRSFCVCLYVDGSSVTYKTVNDLSAGASSTTTFTWSVSRVVSGGDHSVSAYVDKYSKTSSGSITESDESDNEKTKTFQVTKQAPDLIIQDITWNPTSPKTGDMVTFTVTYKNQGTLSTGRNFDVCLYVDGSSVTYKTVNDLSAGASATTTFTWSVSRDVSGGDHSVSAYVDKYSKTSSGSITESDESDNEKTKTFRVTKQAPDLIIQDITWNPTSPKTGDMVTFTVTYKNQGTLSTGRNFDVCLYVDGSSVTYKTVNDLSAGASATTTFTWSVSRDVSGGDHSVSAYVDKYSKTSSGSITESDESDNEKTKTFQVTKQAPDLIIQDITWNPTSPKTGDMVTFTVTYKNQGTLSTGRNFDVCLYVDGSSVTYKTVNDLSAGASATTTFTWSVGRDVSGGDHSVSAYVDKYSKTSSGSITEGDESNNEKTKTFQVTKQAPDLIIQDITWNPTSPKTGDMVTFTVTYKNQGTLSTGRNFDVCLYVDGSSVTYKTVNDLSAGASATTTFTWSVGRDVSGGDHSVSAYVDKYSKTSSGGITEGDESNNEKELNLTITKIYTYADLTISVKDSRNSNPLKSAEVYIDNDLVGRTDSDGKLTKKVVKGEKHVIKVVKSDYYPKIETVDVCYSVGAKEVTIRLDYAKVPITIYVGDENRDEVRNVEVFLDGVSIGITDIEGEVTGDATKNKDVMVKVVKSGYYTEDALIHVGSYKEGYSIKLKCEDLTTPNIVVEKMEIVGDNDDILEVGESVKITYSVKDDSGIKDIRCNLDGSLIDSYTTAGNYSTTTPQLSIGKHVIKFEAIDADINPHKSVKDVSITVSKKGPTVLFQSTKDTINRGENAVFTLGALNPIGRENMTVELILKAPSGVSVSGISFVKSGGGMYQATYEIEPGEGMKFITVDLIGNELGTHKIEAEVHYSVPGGEVLTQHEMLTITVIDESIKTTPTPVPSEAPKPAGFELIFAIAELLAVAYLVGRKK